MSLYNLKLKIYPADKSEYSPTTEINVFRKTEQQLSEVLIGTGVILKDIALPERDSDGKFLKKDKIV